MAPSAGRGASEGGESDQYTVRWYRPDDRAGILSLYETEWGRQLTDRWFEWKYIDDPFLSHVPITVAECDGEIVGTQAYIPSRIRWIDRTVLALQPADAMVHPDHRRAGLYTRITRLGIERYTDHEAAFFFNFPNPGAAHAQEKLGWTVIDQVGTYYRLQQPGDLLELPGDSIISAVINRVVPPVVRGYLDVRDRISRNAPDDNVDIERRSSLPAETLESLYRSAVPGEFHIDRSAAFYRWWFGDPAYDHTVYVAHRGDSPVASIVTRTRNDRKVKLMDALPMGSERTGAFSSLLDAILADHPNTDTIAVAEGTLPASLLARSGFIHDRGRLLSRVSTATNLAVRPLASDGEPEAIPMEVLTDESTWRVTFTEQDRD